MPRVTPLPRKDFEKFLEFVGCKYKRTKGDHLIWDRPNLKRPVVFPADREVPVFIIRNVLRTLDINHDEYLEILKKI